MTTRVSCIVLAISVALNSFAQSETRPQLRAGAATSNITPLLGAALNGHFNDRRATHIHDDLLARCLFLDDGKTQLAIVVCDSCMMPRELLDKAKQRISERAGLSPNHILISSTHTHTAPAATPVFLTDADKDYCETLPARIADGVERARHNLAPAKIGWGVGNVPTEVFNRRWKMKPGTILPNPFGGTNELVKMNPPPGSPDLLEPAGPTDPEISLIALQTAEGKPIALLANYSLHYVGTGRDAEVSADYFGSFAERFQQLIGADHQDPPFVALLSNGTSGDINNINFRQKQPPVAPYQKMRQVADVVAREAQRVYDGLQYREWVPLQIHQTELTLGVRKPSPGEISRAEKILKGANGRPLRGLEEIYARETVLMDAYPATVPVLLQALRIGDVGIAAIPCEVFVEVGLEIKKKSPFKPSFTTELANGCNGYLPTPAQHKLGGYETWRARSSYLEEQASPKIVETLLRLFEECQ